MRKRDPFDIIHRQTPSLNGYQKQYHKQKNIIMQHILRSCWREFCRPRAIKRGMRLTSTRTPAHYNKFAVISRGHNVYEWHPVAPRCAVVLLLLPPMFGRSAWMNCENKLNR